MCPFAELSPNAGEVLYLERKFLSGNPGSTPAGVRVEASFSQARLTDLNRAAAAFQSLATTVSRLPQFPRRFTETITAAARGEAAGGFAPV